MPQGLFLGPILFALNMLPLGHILNNFNCYADDIHLYMSFKPHNVSKLSVLQDCNHAIKNWMAASCLSPNTKKSEVLVYAPDNLVPTITQNLGPLSSSVCHTSRNLVVTFDQVFTLEKHVNGLVQTCFHHLRSIVRLKHSVSQREMEMVTHALISSRLDYFNSLFLCLNKSLLDYL